MSHDACRRQSSSPGWVGGSSEMMWVSNHRRSALYAHVMVQSCAPPIPRCVIT